MVRVQEAPSQHSHRLRAMRVVLQDYAGFSGLSTLYCSTEVSELLPNVTISVDYCREKLHITTSSHVPVRYTALMLLEFLRACRCPAALSCRNEASYVSHCTKTWHLCCYIHSRFSCLSCIIVDFGEVKINCSILTQVKICFKAGTRPSLIVSCL